MIRYLPDGKVDRKGWDSDDAAESTEGFVFRDHELADALDAANERIAQLIPTCAICGRTEHCEDNIACTFDPSPKALYADNCELRKRIAQLEAAPTRGGPRDPCAVWFDRAKAAEEKLAAMEAAPPTSDDVVKMSIRLVYTPNITRHERDMIADCVRRLDRERQTLIINERNCWERRREAGQRVAEAEQRAEAAEAALAEARKDAERLRLAAAMLDAVVEGAQTEFVRVPYGASHEDVAQINDWHKMAAEARAAIAREGK